MNIILDFVAYREKYPCARHDRIKRVSEVNCIWLMWLVNQGRISFRQNSTLLDTLRVLVLFMTLRCHRRMPKDLRIYEYAQVARSN